MGTSSSASVLPVNILKNLFVKVEEESGKLNVTLGMSHCSLKRPRAAPGS